MTRNDILQLVGIIIVFAVVIGVGATALRSRTQTGNAPIVDTRIGGTISPSPSPTTALGGVVQINTTTTLPTPTPVTTVVTQTQPGTTTVITTTTTKGGLTTSSDTTPGQVLVRSEDGTMYLTTTTSDDGQPIPETEAQNAISNNLFGIDVPEGFAEDFSQLLNSILTIVMVISALLVFFYLIWGALEWITSGGDKGKTDRAREKMFAAVVGLIIVAASFAILNLALNFLGFRDLNEVFRSARPLDTRNVLPTPTPLPTPSPTPIP